MLVDQLASATGQCTTCGLQGVQWAPSFSLPVAVPLKADLALSYACNNACAHCYNRERLNSSGDCPNFRASEYGTVPFGTTQWRRVLRRLSAIGVPHVIFTGGEPTLFDGLAELVRTATRLGLVTGLNTNGRRLADRRLTASLRAAGLDHVQITLESHRREIHNAMTGADSFDQTLLGIQNALAVGLHTITNTTLTRRNVEGVWRIVPLLHSLGLRTFAVNGMISPAAAAAAVTPLQPRP